MLMYGAPLQIVIVKRFLKPLLTYFYETFFTFFRIVNNSIELDKC
jgi:hypothetical protein